MGFDGPLHQVLIHCLGPERQKNGGVAKTDHGKSSQEDHNPHGPPYATGVALNLGQAFFQSLALERVIA